MYYKPSEILFGGDYNPISGMTLSLSRTCAILKRQELIW